MSAFYPRLITVTRSDYTPVAGQPLEQRTITVYSAIPARIYLKRDKGFSAPIWSPGKTNTSASMPMWVIDTQLGDNTIQDADIIVDDLQRQYKVDAAYYNGWFMQMSVTPTSPTA